MGYYDKDGFYHTTGEGDPRINFFLFVLMVVCTCLVIGTMLSFIGFLILSACGVIKP